MKNVRVWFTKDNEARYISHLDLNRVMMRAINKAQIPIWHTEGFNPHPFVTFALPLSLGFRGIKETMDMKLISDEMTFKEIIEKLNESLPKSIRVYNITEPVMKPGKICYASFEMKLSSDDINVEDLQVVAEELFKSDKILVEKKSKKGLKTIDIKEHFISYSIKKTDNYVNVDIMLPAGSTTNVNPNLIVTALTNLTGKEIYADITRKDIYNEQKESFV